MAEKSLATTITASTGAKTISGTAGATIAAGEVVYLNTSTGKYDKADAGAATTAVVAGIALHGASDGQPLTILTEGTIAGESGLKPGQTYLLADTAGDLAEGVADLTEDTSYVSYIGVALTAATISVKVHNSGVVLNLS